MEIAELNSIFAIEGHITFKTGTGNFTEAHIENKFAKAVISLYGAHVISYQPLGERDVLWMSSKSAFEAGKPIRGGIPVCFPWFGPHKTDNSKPAHGFARLNIWEVLKTAIVGNNETEIVLGLKHSPETLKLWPFTFSAEMIIRVGKTLDVTLACKNTCNQTFTCTNALHTYISISTPQHIRIEGLQGTTYFAGFAKTADHCQTEAILEIRKEENRRYINHAADCVLTDSLWNRKIRVSKRNSMATVVWNPWEETTKTMPDIPAEGYLHFVCIEAANIYDNAVELQPGGSFSISTVIEIVG